MKITHGAAGVVNRELWAEYLGDTPVLRIIKNGVQIWPDPTDRVRRIVVNTNALAETKLSRIWDYAMTQTQTSSSISKYMRFKFGGSYYFLNSTYAAYQKATYSTGGIITFNSGFGPLRSDVRNVKSISVQIRIPARNSGYIKNGTSTINPPPNGTQVHLLYAKWQKRVSTGCGCTITGRPSGKLLLNVYNQRNGHCRTTCDDNLGNFPTVPSGDTSVSIYSWLHQTDLYGAYLTYPAIKTTITLPILSIE